MIQALLDRCVQSGSIAGAVALVTVGDTEAVTTAGVQDLGTRVPMRPDTIFGIMSTTKPITAAAATILVGGEPVRSAGSVRRMMQDYITPAQKAAFRFFPGFWDRNGWGYCGAVVTRTDGAGPPVGSCGGTGGYGTNFAVDPRSETIALPLTQRLMTCADDVEIATELDRIVVPAANQGEDRP